MIVLVALDNQNGLLFHKRRVSQDALLRRRILELTQGHPLWMSPYSAEQFRTENADNIQVAADFPQRAAEEDYCFVEDVSVADYAARIRQIIVYRWNRDYPSNVKFDMDLSQWQLLSQSDFVGKSHEKITEEVYIPWQEATNP